MNHSFWARIALPLSILMLILTTSLNAQTCDGLVVTPTNNGINVSGLNTGASSVRLFTASWSPISDQIVTASSLSIPNLTAGSSYIVKITLYSTTPGWPILCEKVFPVTLSGTPDPCANDVTPPIFSGCPTSTISIQTNQPSAAATWIAPKATDNCTDIAAVSVVSDHAANFAYPLGTTTVTYTAADTKGNKTTCRFSVNVSSAWGGVTISNTSQTVQPNQKVCVSVMADSFANIGAAQWANLFDPSVLRFDSLTNGSYLRLDNSNWSASSATPGVVNFLYTSATGYNFSIPSGTKLYDLCFTAIGRPGATTNIIQGASPTKRVVLINDNFETIRLNSVVGTVTIAGTPPPLSDIGLSISANTPGYRQWTATTIRVTAKNTGTTPMTNITINTKRPDKMVYGGTRVPSVGEYQDYCIGAVECSLWTIPSLAAGATATLDVPLYALDPTAPITVTTKLLGTTPTDTVPSNNTASVTLSLLPPLFQLVKPSQLTPVVLRAISPNPTNGNLEVQSESFDTGDVIFQFFNSLGNMVKTEVKTVEKGLNRTNFSVSDLYPGLYYVVPMTNQGTNTPIKFMKL